MQSLDSIRDSTRLFKYAVSLDPYATYRDSGAPLPSRMPRPVTRYVTNAYEATHPNREPLPPRSKELLLQGITDSYDTLFPFVAKVKDDPERALALVTHADTVKTLGMLAARSEEAMKSHIADLTFNNAPNRQAVSFDPHIHEGLQSNSIIAVDSTPEGCPFAKKKGRLEIDPLFEDFAKWMGHLTLATMNIYSEKRH